MTGGPAAKGWTPTSATGTWNNPGVSSSRAPGRRTRAGFTLIELLVVVVVIGIISGIVVLSIGILGDDRALQQQAQRLASLIELAEEEAVMQGREFGLEFQRGGYRFVEYDPLANRWQELVGDELLRPRRLDESLELALELEGRPITLAEEAKAIRGTGDSASAGRGGRADYLPHLLITSSGDVTPFALAIRRSTDRAEVQLTMSPAGELGVATVE